MKLDLHLEYVLAEGAIAPHLDGLRRGVAIAAECVASGRTTFPPDRRCGSGSDSDTERGLRWRELPGAARIIHRTDGPAGSFALAQFDGADNCAVCRIVNSEEQGDMARLEPSSGDKPAICIKIGR